MKKQELKNNFFQNWVKNFLEYLNAKEHPDFPSKKHRRLWGIDD